MTEKRFELAYCDYDWWAICDKENPTELGISGEDVVELLNELDEKNEQLKKSIKRQQSSNDECAKLIQEQQKENEQLKVANGEMEDYLARLEEKNEQLKQQLNYIQNSISEHIKHQKTELGQKALKEIIEDYNEWLLGHKELKE